MRQDGLINIVIEALGLDNGVANFKWTKAEYKPIVKDEYGLQVSGQFSYSSAVVIML